MTKLGTRLEDKTGLPVCLQSSIPTAKPELALPSLIGLILKDLQGLHLAKPGARLPPGPSNCTLARVFFTYAFKT